MRNRLFRFTILLRKHNMLGLVVAVIFGLAILRFTEALVSYVIMPFFGLFSDSGNWELLTLSIGRLEFPTGKLLSDFLIFLFLIWLLTGFLTIYDGGSEDIPKDEPESEKKLDL